jgi:hypothetical protein
MGDRVIPRDEWAAFLASFTRQHRAWLATVERSGRRESSLVQQRPLIRIDTDCRGDEIKAIRITVGERSRHQETRVDHPRSVRLLRTAAGDRGLEIDDGDECTRVAFRASAFPDQVDGMAPAEETEVRNKPAFSDEPWVKGVALVAAIAGALLVWQWATPFPRGRA